MAEGEQPADLESAADSALLNSIRSRLYALPGNPLENQPFTIFRVPAHVRETNRTLYEPRMVSIGPYHRRGAPHLRPMEEHKWRYLRDLLSRLPGAAFEGLVRSMKALEAQARRCYAESIDLTADQFTEMLLLDGCFIVEFITKWHRGNADTICDLGWSLPLIRGDFLLVENQIPFFVLQSLYDLIPAPTDLVSDSGTDRLPPRRALIKFVAKYLMRREIELSLKTSDVSHLLHLYHSCYLSTMEVGGSNGGSGSGSSCLIFRAISSLSSYFRRPTTSSLNQRTIDTRTPRTIPCATELQDAGVRFIKKKSSSLLDVTFRNGTMEIPHISIEDSTRSRLMNLVAFEQCNGSEEKKLTSYAMFMDCMINTAGDVAILEERGIMENKLASREEAALFFNQLCDCGYIDYEKHYLAGLFRDVSGYCESDWHRYRAKLMRDYFSNPWAILSLVAALVLLILTLAQTFFAILAYFYPPS